MIDHEYSFFKRFKFNTKKFQIENSFTKQMFYKTKNEYERNLIDTDIYNITKYKNIAETHINKVFKTSD